VLPFVNECGIVTHMQIDHNKKTFAFILGREKELALSELKAVLVRFDFCFTIISVTGNFVFANIDNFGKEDAQKLIRILGGTIKIFQILTKNEKVKTKNYSEHSVLDLLIESLKAKEDHKVDFGISWYARNLPQNLLKFGLKIKKSLKKQGFSVRYVESKEPDLSSILSTKNDLDGGGIEVGIFQNIQHPTSDPAIGGGNIQHQASDLAIGKLLAVNNPYNWSERDFDKPAFDKHSGMVPPKLARMMVNLALGEEFKIQNLKFKINTKNLNSKLKIENCNDCVVVDPFCGSGNILMEAMMLGCDVVGSDISSKSVEDTKANLAWLTQNLKLKTKNYNSKLKTNIFQADATGTEYLEKLTAYCLPLTTERQLAVVTEPYLGEPKKYNPTLNAAKGEYGKVKILYIDFLKNIKDVIPAEAGIQKSKKLDSTSQDTGWNDNSTPLRQGPERQAIQPFNNLILCIVFPLVETAEGKRFSLYEECVDEIEKLGYTQMRSNLIYGRDYQVVKREIALLKLKNEFKI
jgi:tRNA G10  N-methylase Trm11